MKIFLMQKFFWLFLFVCFLYHYIDYYFEAIIFYWYFLPENTLNNNTNVFIFSQNTFQAIFKKFPSNWIAYQRKFNRPILVNISLDRWEPKKIFRNVIGKVFQARKPLLSFCPPSSKSLIILWIWRNDGGGKEGGRRTKKEIFFPCWQSISAWHLYWCIKFG